MRQVRKVIKALFFFGDEGKPAALNIEVSEAWRHGGFEGRGERRAATLPDMGDEGSDRNVSTL